MIINVEENLGQKSAVNKSFLGNDGTSSVCKVSRTQ